MTKQYFVYDVEHGTIPSTNPTSPPPPNQINRSSGLPTLEGASALLLRIKREALNIYTTSWACENNTRTLLEIFTSSWVMVMSWKLLCLDRLLMILANACANPTFTRKHTNTHTPPQGRMQSRHITTRNRALWVEALQREGCGWRAWGRTKQTVFATTTKPHNEPLPLPAEKQNKKQTRARTRTRARERAHTQLFPITKRPSTINSLLQY